MFNTSEGYSLSDIAAVSGGRGSYGYGDGMFGGGGWWIVLLFLFGLGGWGNGGSWGGNSGAQTGYVLDAVNGLAQTATNGIYNLNTGLLTGFANTNAAIASGTSAIQSDICGLRAQGLQDTASIVAAINADTVADMQTGFGISQQLSAMQAAQQLANCQTDDNVTRNFATLSYNLATEACADRAAIQTGVRDIIENSNNNTRSILDFLVQDRINALTSENQALKGQISQSEQNAYLISQLRPNPGPAYLVANPYTGTIVPSYSYGWPTYGSGCGCGCNNNLVG